MSFRLTTLVHPASAMPVDLLDGGLLQPYVGGAIICLLIAVAVVLYQRFKLRQKRGGDGLLSDNVFNAFFGDAQVGIAVVDEHGAIARTNDHLEAMTGYPQSSLIGKLYVDLVFDPSDAAGRDRVVGALDRFGESHMLTIRRSDGSFFRARFIVAPAPASFSRNQSVIFVEEVGPDRDRERAPLEDRPDEASTHRQFNSNGEATVQGSSSPTSVSSPGPAENISSIMNDELLTPLAIVQGYLDLLEVSTEGEQNEILGAVRTGVNQLADRLESLTFYAGLEHVDVSTETIPVDVYRIVADVIDSIKPVTMAPSPVRVIGPTRTMIASIDAGAFSRIVRHLIENAIQFGDGRDVSVSLSSQAGHLVLCVSNTGGGFDPSMRSTVFESFFQVSSGPARKHKGFGLGLAIVRKLVDAMGGTISVSSEVGEGATFLIRVPIRPDSRLVRAA